MFNDIDCHHATPHHTTHTPSLPGAHTMPRTRAIAEPMSSGQRCERVYLHHSDTHNHTLEAYENKTFTTHNNQFRNA